MPGMKQIDATHYELRRSKFVPDADFKLLILQSDAPK
jgi:hypothetical protein